MEENKIIIYQTEDRQTQIDVRLEQDMIWLTRQQLADLFGRDYKTISKHINNALKEELADSVVVAKFANTTQHGAIEGKTQTHEKDYFNLYDSGTCPHGYILDDRYSPDEVIELAELLTKKIIEMPLTTFTKNILFSSGFYTFGEFLKGGKENLSKLRNKGPKVRNEINAFMKEKGLAWDVYVDDIIEAGARHILSKE